MTNKLHSLQAACSQCCLAFLQSRSDCDRSIHLSTEPVCQGVPSCWLRYDRFQLSWRCLLVETALPVCSLTGVHTEHPMCLCQRHASLQDLASQGMRKKIRILWPLFFGNTQDWFSEPSSLPFPTQQEEIWGLFPWWFQKPSGSWAFCIC